MSGAPLTDAAASRLFKCASLKTLWIEETQIGDSGLAYLVKLDSLTELNVSKTKVTASGVAEFSRQNPNCYVYWDGH